MEAGFDYINSPLCVFCKTISNTNTFTATLDIKMLMTLSMLCASVITQQSLQYMDSMHLNHCPSDVFVLPYPYTILRKT